MISKVNQFKGHNLNNVHDEHIEKRVRIMVFNNISVISWRSVFFGGGNWRKPPPCRKELTNLIT